MSKLFKEICEPLHIKATNLKYPSFPIKYIPPLDIKGTSTNKLEKMIVAFIQLHGWWAERVKNTGTARIETIKRSNGNHQTKANYTKGTGVNGSADIHSTINGRTVAIEVKNAKTKDRMSAAQEQYKKRIELTGGIYYVATDIDSFIEWYKSNFEINQNWENVILDVYFSGK